MALKQLDLSIAQGKMTGIVGASGAGKTTLIHLILRFYEPTEGRICADGQAISDFD